MTFDDAKSMIRVEIQRIAPEADFAGIADSDDLREALDLDSMDIFNLVIAISKRLGVDIPDADAGRLVTLGGGAEYVAQIARPVAAGSSKLDANFKDRGDGNA